MDIVSDSTLFEVSLGCLSNGIIHKTPTPSQSDKMKQVIFKTMPS